MSDQKVRLKILLINERILHGIFKDHKDSIVELTDAYFSDDPLFRFNIRIKDSDIMTFVQDSFYEELKNEEVYDFTRSFVNKQEAGFYEITDDFDESKDPEWFDLAKASTANYNQIAENEKRFGIKTGYVESFYTNDLDKNSEFYKKNVIRAKRIEKDILRNRRRSNYDGEERYSCVVSTKGGEYVEKQFKDERGMKADDDKFNKDSSASLCFKEERYIKYNGKEEKGNKVEKHFKDEKYFNREKNIKKQPTSTETFNVQERKVRKSKPIVWECNYNIKKGTRGTLKENSRDISEPSTKSDISTGVFNKTEGAGILNFASIEEALKYSTSKGVDNCPTNLNTDNHGSIKDVECYFIKREGNHSTIENEDNYINRKDEGNYISSKDIGNLFSRKDDGNYSNMKIEGNLISSKNVVNYNGSKNVVNYNGRKDDGSYSSRKDDGSYSKRNDEGNYNGSKDIGNLISRKDDGSYSSRKDIGSYSSRKDVGNYNGRKIDDYSGRKDEGNHVAYRTINNLSTGKVASIYATNQDVNIKNESRGGRGVIEESKEVGKSVTNKEIGPLSSDDKVGHHSTNKNNTMNDAERNNTHKEVKKSFSNEMTDKGVIKLPLKGIDKELTNSADKEIILGGKQSNVNKEEKSSKRVTYGRPYNGKYESMTEVIQSIRANFKGEWSGSTSWGCVKGIKDYREEVVRSGYKRI